MATVTTSGLVSPMPPLSAFFSASARVYRPQPR